MQVMEDTVSLILFECSLYSIQVKHMCLFVILFVDSQSFDV